MNLRTRSLLIVVVLNLFLSLAGLGAEEVLAANKFLRKTDGAFATDSGAFVPIPGTLISFTTLSRGPAIFWVSATEEPDCLAVAQLGVRVDGVDFPLAANHIHTFAGGVGVFRIVQGGVTFVRPLSIGAHTAEVVIRRLDAACGNARVQADADFPLNFVIQHR